MKTYEFESKCLEMILNKQPEYLVDIMNDVEMAENMCEFFNIWATYRHDPVQFSSAISRFIAGMISYEAKYACDDEPTAEDLHNYNEDMKVEQWERQNDF